MYHFNDFTSYQAYCFINRHPVSASLSDSLTYQSGFTGLLNRPLLSEESSLISGLISVHFMLRFFGLIWWKKSDLNRI